MKRFFILASAAIVALASCAKTEVVYKDAPQEISFKKITNVMTKADPTPLEKGSLGVFAHYNGLNGNDALYFSNGEFAWDEEKNYYVSEPTYAWPITGGLDFTVYYPYVEGSSYDLEEQTLTIDFTADMFTGVNPLKYEDLYYGSDRLTNKKKGDNLVANLHHIATKVTVKFDETNYTFVSATVDDCALSGIVEVAYGNSLEVTVDADDIISDGDENAFNDANDLTITENEGSVVFLPGSQTKILVVFKQNAGDQTEIKRTVDLTDGELTWDAHTNYLYEISVGDNAVITFKAQPNDWVDANPQPEDVVLPAAE